MKKKQLIYEVMGVPKALDPWIDILADTIVTTIDEIIKRDEWHAGESGVTGVVDGNYTLDDGTEITVKNKKVELEDGEYRFDFGLPILVKGGKIVESGRFPYYESEIKLDGKEFEKRFLLKGLGVKKASEMVKTKEFSDFPLLRPQITVRVALYPDDIYKILGAGDSNRMQASHSYDISKIDLGKLFNREVFTHNILTFDAVLPFSYIENRTEEHTKNIINAAKPTIGHELLHSYQTYQQMLGKREKGLETKKGAGFGREGMLNMLQQMMRFQDLPSWSDFIHTVYLHLSFEVNARVTEMYYDMKEQGVKTKEEVLNFLYSSEPWKDYEMLINFDAEKFIEDFEMTVPEDEDPFTKAMRRMRAMMTGQTIPDDDKFEVMKHLINRWDKLIQQGQKKLKEMGVDIPYMENVPQAAKEDPYLFFKFFEKRFHKKANNFKVKLGKVASMVIDEAKNEEK